MHLYTIHSKAETKILRTKCAPFDFTKHTKKEISTLITEMRIKMKEWAGVGLAATQIGRTDAIFVAQIPDGKFYAIFNPRITKISDLTLLEEGCLSVPGRYGEIERGHKVTLEGQDRNGKTIKIKAFGLLAEVFQHETDHLQGILYIDRAHRVYEQPTTERLRGQKLKTKES